LRSALSAHEQFNERNDNQDGGQKQDEISAPVKLFNEPLQASDAVPILVDPIELCLVIDGSHPSDHNLYLPSLEAWAIIDRRRLPFRGRDDFVVEPAGSEQ
jgi:hypothetical protein